MKWQKKLDILQSITSISLCMRFPGNWFVHAPGRSIDQDGGKLGTRGEGPTPKKAVEEDFKIFAQSGAKVRIDGIGGRPDKTYRWIGHVWQEITK